MPYKDYEKKKEHSREYSKIYFQRMKTNPTFKKDRYERVKEWRLKNPKKFKQHIKKYCLRNREIINKKKLLYQKERIRNDKNYNLRLRLRTMLYQTLKRYTQTGKVMSSKKYGIDYRAIIEYLKPFPEDLCNYDIHHIKPLFTFKFVNADGSTNFKTIKEAFKPENHKLITIEEHTEVHKKDGTILETSEY